jgi:hypothetical protein
VRSQKGFSHIIIILVVLVLAIAGVVGWWAWDRVQKNNEKPGADSSSEAAEAENNLKTLGTANTVADVPEGYTLYESQDFQIKFAYPTEWGTVSTVAPWCQQQGHLLSGGGTVISFSDNSLVQAGIRTVDWEHDTNIGHGGSENASSLAPVATYVPGNLNYLAHDVIKDDATGFLGLKPLCQEGGCYGMGLILVHALSGNIYTNGVSFVYSPDVEVNLLEDATQAQADALPWAANFPQSLIDQFTVIDSTIANL